MLNSLLSRNWLDDCYKMASERYYCLNFGVYMVNSNRMCIEEFEPSYLFWYTNFNFTVRVFSIQHSPQFNLFTHDFVPLSYLILLHLMYFHKLWCLLEMHCWNFHSVGIVLVYGCLPIHVIVLNAGLFSFVTGET